MNNSNKGNPWGTRRLISLISIGILGFVVVYCLVFEKTIPQEINAILTAFIGFIGYHFGKSTVQDGVQSAQADYYNIIQEIIKQNNVVTELKYEVSELEHDLETSTSMNSNSTVPKR